MFIGSQILGQDFTVFSGSAVSVGSYTDDGTVALATNDSNGISITFTADSSTVVVAWSGHIASSLDWGDGVAAGDITGSPFHTFLTSLEGQDAPGNVGNRDVQLAAKAVIPLGSSITVIKDSVPNDLQDFGFTTSGDGLASFSLDDDSGVGGATNDLLTTEIFADLTQGPYSVTETLPVVGWDLTNIGCTGQSSSTVIFTGATATPTDAFETGDHTVEIGLIDGEDVICTFTNTLRSSNFTVVKQYSDSNTTEVNVGLACVEGVTPVTVVGSPKDTTSLSATFAVTGWTTKGDVTCTGTETTVPEGYSSSGTCNASLGTGTCTITNTLNSGDFEVVKDFSDDSTAEVTVGLSCASGSVNDVDTTASEADDADFTVSGFSGDPLCTATETSVPSGYSSSGTCAALLSVGTCTIVNTLVVVDVPAISIVKSPSSQSILSGTTANFTITVTNSGNVTLNNVTVTDPLAPDCDRALGTLTATQSTNYSCSLSNVASAFTNVATATGTPAEGDPVQDSDSAAVTIFVEEEEPPDDDEPPTVTVVTPTPEPEPEVLGTSLAIDKALTSADPARVGETVTFDIELSFSGDTTVSDVTLTDVFENEFLAYTGAFFGDFELTCSEFANATAGHNSVTCAVGDVTPGSAGSPGSQSYTFRVEFTALAPTTPGRTLNQAWVEGTVEGSKVTLGPATADVEIVEVLGLQLPPTGDGSLFHAREAGTPIALWIVAAVAAAATTLGATGARVAIRRRLGR